MSKREMEQKFTKSEIVLIGWRSMETAFQMQQKTKAIDTPAGSTVDIEELLKGAAKRPDMPGNLPKHFYNEEGELDLSKVSGGEAYRYLTGMGIPFGVMPGLSKEVAKE